MHTRKLFPYILPFAILSLLTGVWAGWLRIGWDFPVPEVAGKHGALMVGSFLGTLISLERAVVLKKRWVLIVPLLSGLSLILFVGQQDTPAFIALTAGSVGQAAIMAHFLNKHKEYYMSIMFAGSLCWLTGNLMWLTYHLYPMAVPWWMAFLLLMITGERLELTRFLPVNRNKRLALFVALVVFMVGIIIPFHGNGRFLAGMGLMFTGLWLLKYDMAVKSLKKKGQHRYSAVLLMTGYCWLILSGLLMITGEVYGYLYDAVLHTFFVGFVFSMIFAHAPVILPAVLGLTIQPYHRFLYTWVIFLQGSLALRITADLLSLPVVRQWSGLLNGLTIIAFFGSMAILVRLKMRKAYDLKLN